MPILLEKALKMIGWSLIKSWASKNLLPILAKWFVKSTDNKWDDKVYSLIMAIRNNEPTEKSNKLLEELLDEMTNAK